MRRLRQILSAAMRRVDRSAEAPAPAPTTARPDHRDCCTATFARGLAFAAMVLQFLFYADHIGADAVAGVGAGSPGERYGFLEICTGDGIALISADGRPVASPSDCPICRNASILAFAPPFAMAPPVVDVGAVARLPRLAALRSPAEARFPGTKPIRGPPGAVPA